MAQTISEQLLACENLKPREIVNFLQKLAKEITALSKEDMMDLLDYFCRKCWELKNLQSTCYELVSSLIKKGDKEAKQTAISKLMEKSDIYPDFSLLAKELLAGIPEENKKMIKIQSFPLGQTFIDGRTQITKGEFDYLQGNGYKCWITTDTKGEHKFYRYQTAHDLVCEEAGRDVLIATGQIRVLVGF